MAQALKPIPMKRVRRAVQRVLLEIDSLMNGRT